jgi:hypothetical protein
MSTKAQNTSQAATKVEKKAATKVEKLNYKSHVIGTNHQYKKEMATLGHCVRSLMQAQDVKIHPKMMAILREIKANKNDWYKIALDGVRKTKSGKYTPFCLLQYLYKLVK